MKTFVIGDIHGGHKALVQCLERSKFDYDKDELICLGDVCDGWQETPECIDELKKIKNLIYILGNHDKWLMDYFTNGSTPIIWVEQGGQATLDAYIKNPEKIIEHRDFFNKASYYMHDEDVGLFVHGGILKNIPLNEHYLGDFMWDRSLAHRCFSSKDYKGDNRFKEIFIGHTTTSFHSDVPIHVGNVWLLDQGAGYEGKLSILNVKTKEFWQSDKVSDLYPDFRGRN
jgi:predicted phosphodiesterase